MDGTIDKTLQIPTTPSFSPSDKLDPVQTFLWGEEVTDFSSGGDELLDYSRADTSEMGFKLREGHFDGIEIGHIGEQK